MNPDQPRPRAKDVLHVWRALKLVWGVARAWTAAAVGLAIVQGVLPLLAVYLTKLIVDAVTKGITAADKAAAWKHVAVLIAAAAIVAVVTAAMRSLATLVNDALAQTVSDHVTDLIHSKSIAVDLRYYEDARYYDVLHRAQQEAPTRPVAIVNDLLSTGQSLVSLVGMAALLLTLHWSFGIIVLVAAIPGAWVKMHYSRRMYGWQRGRTDAERRAWYYHWLLTNGAHAKEIRLFGLGEMFRDWFRETRRELRGERIGISSRRAAADFGAGLVAALAIFGTFAFIAWRTIEGAITLGSMVMYYQAFQTSLSSLQALLGGLAGLYEDNLFLTYYHEFMTLEPAIAAPREPAPVPHPLASGVRFEGVSFRYPETERVALHDIDVEFRPGEVTAIVGANGSGKTTLVKLLCRLYDPESGRVTFDGVDARRMDPDGLRRGISVIFQDYTQYQLTAAQNIWMGNTSLDADGEEVRAAARDAGADEVITALRRGYDTMLGKWFEAGEELSVGEWQKVALARAFVRDADVIVLDEPTSALDPSAEQRVFRHLRELAAGRVVIVISHRYSTVRDADRIHIVARGSVIESGSHAELLAAGGVYADMFNLQMRWAEDSP